MNIKVTDAILSIQLHGFSGTAINKDYAGTAFQLMDRMWKLVKSNNLMNKGRNIWVYEPGEKVFAGVELEQPPSENIGLEQKSIVLNKYATYTHVGPYSLIKQTGQRMRDELHKKHLKVGSVYIEIYGHWTNDESKLETDLLMSID